LQGIALLNIPYTHGGSNLWGEHLSQKRIRKAGPFKKGKKLKTKELSANSFNSVDLSIAIQGEFNLLLIFQLSWYGWDDPRDCSQRKIVWDVAKKHKFET
jgi:hypothetical protein